MSATVGEMVGKLNKLNESGTVATVPDNRTHREGQNDRER